MNKRAASARSRVNDESDLMERPPVDAWSPANMLETPEDGEYHYRWVVEYCNGSPMPNKVQQRIREKWSRVLVEDLPEDFVLYDPDSKDGYVHYSGLILMRLPMALYRAQQAYYEREAAERLNAANELQGIAGRNAFVEDRSRSLTGADAGRALSQMKGG